MLVRSGSSKRFSNAHEFLHGWAAEQLLTVCFSSTSDSPPSCHSSCKGSGMESQGLFSSTADSVPTLLWDTLLDTLGRLHLPRKTIRRGCKCKNKCQKINRAKPRAFIWHSKGIFLTFTSSSKKTSPNKRRKKELAKQKYVAKKSKKHVAKKQKKRRPKQPSPTNQPGPPSRPVLQGIAT